MAGGKIATRVDKMLFNKASFEDIMQVTGWTMDEIWIYMDMCFRLNNPEFSECNKHYCIWGMEEDEPSKVK